MLDIRWCGFLDNVLRIIFVSVLIQHMGMNCAQVEESCMMTLVVPKEKIKHTCDVQEKFEKKLNYLEGQVIYQRKLIEDLEMLLVKEKQKGSLTDTQVQKEKKHVRLPDLGGPDVDEDYTSSLPDLSDDYPDFSEYFPPEVTSRLSQGGDRQGSNKSSSNKRDKPYYKSEFKRGLNIMGLDLLKPYIDREFNKIHTNLTERLSGDMIKFAAGYEELKQLAAKSPGAQASANTLALSNMLSQVSKLQDQQLHMNTQHVILQKKVSVLEARLLSLRQMAGQRTTDLRTKLLELEHENRLLKMNHTCASQLQEVKLDVANQISDIKDQMKVNCKSKRRPKVRSRISQGDYYYDDEADDDNVIDDNFKPLREMPQFQELQRNVSGLHTLLAHQTLRLEETSTRSQATWNKTETFFKQVTADQQRNYHHLNISTQLGLQQIQQQIDSLGSQVTDIKVTANHIQEDIVADKTDIEDQFLTLKQVVSDLQHDTRGNFTKQADNMRNVSAKLESNIQRQKQYTDQQSEIIKKALGNFEQKSTENRLSIMEWRDRVWENNVTLSHLSTDLRHLSEQVEVSVLSLNNTINTIEVQLKINNETWLPYNFTYSKSHVKCYGQRYVRRTNYESGSIVGVVLCSKDMYKIFLSDSLSDTFLNIADGNGFGKDHCEFVGGKLERSAQLGHTPVFYVREYGYKRSIWGQQPIRTKLGIMNPSPEWYRCAVSIPG